MPVLLRFLAVGSVTPGTTAMTLLLGIAGFLGFMTFVGTHADALKTLLLFFF